MFSRRSAHDTRQNRLALALRARPPELDLCSSNPTTAGLPYPTDEIVAALDNAAARSYEPDPRGLPPARRAIAADLQRDGTVIDPEHILLSSGTSEAYGQLFKLLCDPGDEVLVPSPSYPLLAHLTQLECVTAVPYPLRYDGRWHIDLTDLRAALSARTRAVVVVSPNNPTGSYLKHDELLALQALGLPIVSDEVFARYPLRDDAQRARTVLGGDRGLVFALSGLSKRCALPQWKVSWTCLGGAEALVREAASRLTLISDTYLSVATPTQLALPALLPLLEPTHRALHARLRRNLSRLRAAVIETPLTLLDVEGGFYAPLRLPSTRTDEQWALALLEKDRVHVQPGYFFDFADEAHIVLSLLTPEAQWDEGLARLVRRVSR